MLTCVTAARLQLCVCPKPIFEISFELRKFTINIILSDYFTPSCFLHRISHHTHSCFCWSLQLRSCPKLILERLNYKNHQKIYSQLSPHISLSFLLSSLSYNLNLFSLSLSFHSYVLPLFTPLLYFSFLTFYFSVSLFIHYSYLFYFFSNIFRKSGGN